jgi:hypothetical protein
MSYPPAKVSSKSVQDLRQRRCTNIRINRHSLIKKIYIFNVVNIHRGGQVLLSYSHLVTIMWGPNETHVGFRTKLCQENLKLICREKNNL